MSAFSRRGACPALSAPMRTGDGFIVRLNPVAGGFAPNTLVGLCESALRHGNGVMEVTARGSLQIRGLTAESAALLAADVDAMGIAVRSGVPVETGPLAGIDPDEIADPRPLAEAIRATVADAGLSRRLGPKVSVVVDGGGRIDLAGILADIRLVAERQAGQIAWHLAIGGDATAARPRGVFSESAASNAATAILAAIAGLGREGRARDLDPARINAALALIEHAPRRAVVQPGRSSPLAIFPLSATHALGVALPFGSMPAEKIVAATRKAVSLGCAEIRLAPGRALLFLGPDAETCRQLQQSAAALGFVIDPADPRVAIAACPGAPACASGRIATRDIASGLAATDCDLLDGSFTLHVSGCAKGCAHPGPAALAVVGGENGAGLVVDGTAKTLPGGISPHCRAGSGLRGIASLVRGARRPGETAAACLARLGRTKIDAAFARE